MDVKKFLETLAKILSEKHNANITIKVNNK